MVAGIFRGWGRAVVVKNVKAYTVRDF